MSTTKQSGPRKISHQEGLALYLAMGPDRSLRKLRKALDEDPDVRTPCLNSISDWSKKYAWPVKAAQYDQELADKVVEKAAESAVEKRIRLADALMENALALNAMLGVRLVSVGDGGKDEVQISSGADLKAATDAIERMVRLHDSLVGGDYDSGKRGRSRSGNDDPDMDRAIEESENVRDLRERLRAANGG